MALRVVTAAVRPTLLVACSCSMFLVSEFAAGQGSTLTEIDVPVAPIEADDSPELVAREPSIDAASLAAITAQQAAGVIEEVIVRGQTPGALRIQIELAEEAVYDRFNEINSNDEFDIHCEEVAFTGSRMLTRFCQPNFWHATEEAIAYETVRLLQGSAFSMPTGIFRGEAHYKRQLMREEIERLAREDEEFLEALRHLYLLTVGDEPE